jgi:hypothetical protein
MIRLVVARNCGPTARTLAELLADRGTPVTAAGEGTVSWGVHLGDQPRTLNGLAGGADKLQQLQRLTEAGIRTVPFIQGGRAHVYGHLPRFPALARKRRHRGGTDIRFCANARVAERWLRRGWDFLSPVVPSRTEFRVWLYRGAHLGSYEKVQARPRDAFTKDGKRRFGRNHRNGWVFQIVQSDRVNREVVELARQSLDALGWDFGAVDVLMGNDGRPYILEANSAPGVSAETSFVLNSLADKIANWAQRGFRPRRQEG